jgi:hypothetical protein
MHTQRKQLEKGIRALIAQLLTSRKVNFQVMNISPRNRYYMRLRLYCVFLIFRDKRNKTD